MVITVEWSELKSFVDSREVSIQFIETSDRYILSSFDGIFSLNSIIFKTDPANDEQLDFETNYKAKGNKSDIQMDWFQRMSTQGKIFATGSAFATVDDSETSLLLLKNPSTTKSAHIFKASMSTDSVQVLSTFKFYASPVVTSDGSQVPIRNQRQGFGTVSEMQAFQLPTTSTKGDFVTSRVIPPGTPTQNFDLPHLYVVGPGEEVLITVQNSISGTQSQVVLLWVEL